MILHVDVHKVSDVVKKTVRGAWFTNNLLEYAFFKNCVYYSIVMIALMSLLLHE